MTVDAGSAVSLLQFSYFSFLTAVSLIKETALLASTAGYNLITYPDAVYNFSTDAILIQTRCVQSVVSLEKYYSTVRVPCLLKLFANFLIMCANSKSILSLCLLAR